MEEENLDYLAFKAEIEKKCKENNSLEKKMEFINGEIGYYLLNVVENIFERSGDWKKIEYLVEKRLALENRISQENEFLTEREYLNNIMEGLYYLSPEAGLIYLEEEVGFQVRELIEKGHNKNLASRVANLQQLREKTTEKWVRSEKKRYLHGED